eukprot:TRINITY_DN1125_c0_g1_i1.p2 TRINITY_DN1125_c0_g1~~TRINITY_DN1125_c0_g1_i1.p2  ORF type:complete len:234 (-),score=9.29 TRINITY_DN1125_c0_g1_i1:682-1383(-)
MSTAQMMTVNKILKCILVFALKTSAQTYSSYGIYDEYMYAGRKYFGKVVPNNLMIYGSYSEPAAIYGFQKQYSPEVTDQIINWLMPIPNIPHHYYISPQSDLSKALLETAIQQQQQQIGKTSQQEQVSEQAIQNFDAYINPVQERESSMNQSDTSQESEESIHIPHKPKYIEDEEAEQRLSPSGSRVLSSSEIAGIILGGLMVLVLVFGSIGAVYIFYIRRNNNQSLSHMLLF